MKKGGPFFNDFLIMCKCSQLHFLNRVTIALNNKELHKKYSRRDYYRLGYTCDFRHGRRG